MKNYFACSECGLERSTATDACPTHYESPILTERHDLMLCAKQAMAELSAEGDLGEIRFNQRTRLHAEAAGIPVADIQRFLSGRIKV